MESRVVFRSGLDEPALYDAIASAACLVLPSEREGQGIVVAEAQAVGTPPIVAVAPESAASDFVTDGVDGLLYPVGDVARLAKALGRMLAGGSVWSIISEAATSSAARLDWDSAILPQIVSIYRRML